MTVAELLDIFTNINFMQIGIEGIGRHLNFTYCYLFIQNDRSYFLGPVISLAFI